MGRGIWISEGQFGTTAAHTGARRLAEAAERALGALSAPPLAGSKLPDRSFRQERALILLEPPPGEVDCGLCLAGHMLTINKNVRLGCAFLMPLSSLLIEYQRLSCH